MTRVLFFGTHPKQFNGYSKVVYELAKSMSKMKDIDLTIYGFQNFHDNKKHRIDFPNNVNVYDAFANENPKSKGFGQNEVRDFVQLHDPDVVIVYNDMVVLSSIVTELKKIPNARFKIIGYIDQVYLNQKKMFIDFINKNIDVSMLFTEHWENIIKELGVTTPTCYLPHGFNKLNFYPIPKEIARSYFNLSPDDFIILNLNRNQPRKRWDICLKAFAEIVSRHPNDPIKMMIGTSVQGEWNLLEMFERELKKRSLTLEDGMKHLIIMDNPQKVTDEETNLLYNVADIGINTCDGEGFGLCNFEQAGIGIPQIVPRLGGFIDFFDDECAILQDPQMAYYVGSSRDSVGGEALLISYIDVVDAIETYYKDKEMRARHGSRARKKIMRDYKWDDIAKKLRRIIKQAVGVSLEELDRAEKIEEANLKSSIFKHIERVDTSSEKEKEGIEEEEKDKKGGDDGESDKIDSEMMKKFIPPSPSPESNPTPTPPPPSPPTPPPPPPPTPSSESLDPPQGQEQEKKEKKEKKKVTKSEVLALQRQISSMLQLLEDDDDDE